MQNQGAAGRGATRKRTDVRNWRTRSAQRPGNGLEAGPRTKKPSQNNRPINQRDKHDPRTTHYQSYFGYSRLKNLSSMTNSNDVMTVIAEKESEFQKLISHEMSPDALVLVLNVLTAICNANFVEIIARILSQACSDSFLKTLENYLSRLPLEGPAERKTNILYHDDKNRFWENLNNLFKRIIELLPRTACNKLLPLLQKVNMILRNIDTNQTYKIDDKVKVAFEDLLKELEEEIRKIEEKNVKDSSVLRHEIIQLEGQPPENYRALNVIPRLEDLYDEHPFFRACKVKDAYDSVEHYLDVQFRLLREDFLMPLRSGLKEYLSGNQRYRNGDFRIYRHVRLFPLESSENNIGNKLSFGKSKTATWHSSKRFMYGSLLLLSRDNFRTVLFATVSGCDKKYIANGYILIEPCAGSAITTDLYQFDFVVLESKIFFEPYFQVLTAMQNISAENFPMEAYLIRAEVNVQVPAYLRHQPVLRFKDHRLPVEPDEPWPTAKQLDMDESQYKAFKSAITQEFAIVQGPPGTGKTFLALQIVRVLLENEDNWRKHGPIVVVCLTNHALDQFLEYILQYTTSVVRIGSRSKSELLKNFTLMKRREALGIKSRGGAMMFHTKEDIEHVLSDIRKYRLFKKYLTTPNIIVPLKCLFNEYPSSQFTSDKELVYWLTGINVNDEANPNERTSLNHLEVEAPEEADPDEEEDANMYTDNDIIFENIGIKRFFHLNPTYPLDMIDQKIHSIQTEIWKLQNNLFSFLPFSDELEELNSELDALKEQRLHIARELSFHPILSSVRIESNDPRWKAYWRWVDSTVTFINDQIVESEAKCRRMKVQLEQYKQLANLEILQRHKIVGLTTTCAARIQASLRALSVPIVLVEEAAEILEAHIVSSITKECQHVILIGDHKQLRPKASVYELGIRYNLNVSLFERMVNIRGECLQLAYQHRMRPEISKLITPSIYTTLYNHKVVRDYPSVKGVEKSLFFLNHERREQPYRDEESWKNEHEVKFFLAFAKYLLFQGYGPLDITILCTYSGQLFTFMNEIRNHALLKDVRVTTVDDYQGEENKIILLSLVRNNGAGNVGFLKEENRVCVALSRAKYGLYVMGNMRDLVVKNNIWPKINRVLEEDESIGDVLRLKCQMHPDETFEMKTADDFKKCPEGGCSRKCDSLLQCGHRCTSVCHTMDREHKDYRCKQTCPKSCPNKHPCLMKCYQACPKCRVPMERELKCGHTVDVPCFMDPEFFECPVKVKVTLADCDHVVEKECHQRIEDCKCTSACEIRLPCGHACEGKCHMRTDPDHLLYKCIKECAKTNKGCENNHACPKRCFQDCEPCKILVRKVRSCGHQYPKFWCSVKIEDFPCYRSCKRKMSCGHFCKLRCSEECKNCPEKMEKQSTCGHAITVKCCEEATPSKCHGKCPKVLPCLHPCTEKCRDQCTVACKVMIELKEPARCGHVFSVPCYLQNSDTSSPEILKYCQTPCDVELACGHRCTGNCGSCHQGRMHILCKEPCRTIFICGHKCETPCNEECLPCIKKCELKCQHSKCNKKCGQPCVSCKEWCGYRCKHRRCTRRCNEPCNIKPCTEPCDRILRCGHACVGFCGEPCPILCRICNKDQLTEILFGNEDDDNARFVLLPDCRHCIESEGLLQWITTLSAPGQSIQVKCCPKCKTPIKSCMRVMNQIKEDLANLMAVKTKIFFQNRRDLEKKRKECFFLAKHMIGDPIVNGFPKLKNVFQRLETQGKEVNKRRQQILSFYEINAFKNIVDISIEITHTLRLLEKPHTYNFIQKQVEFLTGNVPKTLQISKQRLEDIQLELRRLQIMVKFQSTFSKANLLIDEKEYNDFIYKMAGIERFSQQVETEVIDSSHELKKLSERNTLIVRETIVKAIGLSKGHWFKCPNGHFYAIGECGGAMQRGRCIECGATVGGGQHRVVRGNALATEIDGATAPAWPGTV